MACHSAEPKNNAPKPKRTATQKNVMPCCTRVFQKRRDLKSSTAITVYQRKSHSQCTPAKTEKPRSPKSLAFIINAVPIVIHQRMKPALAAVVQIPAITESCFEPSGLSLILCLFL